MPTHSAQENPLYSDWNPHFTPAWLSERLSCHLPANFVGSVIDPACGAGNLLAAAALRTRATKRKTPDIEFLGTDTSIRAVRDCERVLANLLPKGNYRIQRADFLKVAPTSKFGQSIVVMNPPFCGYGLLSKPARRQISKMEMRGRFNLSYAFVQRAIIQYRPEQLVSLLPSNWIYTRNSIFRTELDSLGGHWEWEDVGDSAFKGMDVHLGILLWRPNLGKAATTKLVADRSVLPDSGLDVRQGVATGRDALFFEIGNKSLPFGKFVLAVRGRDIGRGSGTKIWVPPKDLTSLQKKMFMALPRKMLQSLRARSCVASKRKRIFEYHEAFPSWFFGKPKILLPEIATGKVRVELDAKGVKLPLHSAIAIRVESVDAGRSLKHYIETSQVQRMLLSTGPRLAGGAARLQVGAIRDALSRWSKTRKTAKK